MAIVAYAYPYHMHVLAYHHVHYHTQVHQQHRHSNSCQSACQRYDDFLVDMLTLTFVDCDTLTC